MATKNYGKGKAMKILSYKEADRLISNLTRIAGANLDYPARAKIANIRKKQEACVALTETDEEILKACISRASINSEVKKFNGLVYNR